MKDPITSSESYLGSVTGNCFFLFFSQNNTRVFGPFPSSPPQKKKMNIYIWTKVPPMAKAARDPNQEQYCRNRRGRKNQGFGLPPLYRWPPWNRWVTENSLFPRGAVGPWWAKLPNFRLDVFECQRKNLIIPRVFVGGGFGSAFCKKKKRPAGTIKLATWGLKKGEPLENQPVIIPYPC